MKALFGVVCALVVGASAAVGCSSSSSGGGGSTGSTPSGTYCNVTTAGVQICYGYTNLNSDQMSSVNMECTSSLMGTVATSCPTSGQVGCCSQTVSGYTVNECYYCGPASSYQSACTAVSGATWTAGSGGPATCGDAGSGSGSGSGSGGGSGSGSGGESDAAAAGD